MRPIKFEIIIDNPPAIDHLLGAIRAIMEEGDLIKLEISKVEEGEEWADGSP